MALELDAMVLIVLFLLIFGLASLVQSVQVVDQFRRNGLRLWANERLWPAMFMVATGQ